MRWLIVAVLLCAAAHAEPVWRNCSLVNIVDGDTVVLRCAGWSKEERVRIVGYNTPERCQPGYAESTQWLKHTLPQTLTIEQVARDRYGRVLAKIYYRIAKELVQVIAPPEHRAKRVKCPAA